MARYDISLIKTQAIGRWPELLGLDSQILNRSHQPCPKCGGRDRFRALDDFDRSGAVICNKCFHTDNGDGIATFAWLHDCSNGSAIVQLAKKLGIEPAADGKANSGSPSGKTRRKKSNQGDGKDSVPPKKQRPLNEIFKPLPWNESLAALFCARKGGIVAPSLVAVGAGLAAHSGITVLTLPIRNDRNQVVGFTAANITGGKIAIPSDNPEAEADTTSWKNKIQSKAKGIIGTPNLLDAERRARITRVFKTEGPSDLLALIPLLDLATEAAFCNPCGANENPENFPWLAEWLTGKQVIVIHDRDAAGVSGAMGSAQQNRLGWATWAAIVAENARNIELPYPLVDARGKDLRDWIRDGGNRKQLDRLINDSPNVSPMKPEDCDVELSTNESITVSRVIELLARRSDVYQRNSQLVQSLVQPTPFGKGDSITIREIPFPAIRTIISGACRFYMDTEDGERRYKSVPSFIPSQVACQGSYPGIPYLIGVTEYPILRPDGSICYEEGYDEETKTMVRCTADLSKIIEHPTREDALRAVERLADLVCDFPFAKPEYRSAWIASVLTAVARPAIRGPVPLMLYDASSSGSGKSRLADITAIALTGRPMPRTPWPSKDEEVRKSITATLRGGQPLLCFDNCRTVLGGQSIEALGTAETWSDRILGESRNTSELSVRTVFFFTANNASLTEDASRRMCYLRIEPETDRPESRTGFKYEDLLDFVYKNRGQVIADIVTILRAYQVAGSPRVDGIPWGSYEDWCRVVRDPLIWLNMADPRQGTIELSNIAVAEDSGDEMIEALETAGIDNRGWTSREILEAANAIENFSGGHVNRKLHDAVFNLVGEKKISVKILGKELKKLDGKLFAGKKIVSFFDSDRKIYRWKILEAKNLQIHTSGGGENTGLRVGTGLSGGQISKEVNVISNKYLHHGGGELTPFDPGDPVNHCFPNCSHSDWANEIKNGWMETKCKKCGRFIGRKPNNESGILNDC